jgi:hypothetical protein
MPTKRSPLFLTSQSRVWIIPNRAGPGNAPEYQSYARGGGFSWNQGGVNPVRGPSDEEFGKFVVLATTQEQAELPQLNIEWRSTRQRSEVLALLRGGCPFDVQIHIGTCRSPLDFDFGAEKVIVLEGGHLDTYAIPDLGAFDKDQEAPGQENSQITGQDWYEVLPIIGNEVAAAEVINPIVAINICDSRSCGECGISSNGCQIIFAVGRLPGPQRPGARLPGRRRDVDQQHHHDNGSAGEPLRGRVRWHELRRHRRRRSRRHPLRSDSGPARRRRRMDGRDDRLRWRRLSQRHLLAWPSVHLDRR